MILSSRGDGQYTKQILMVAVLKNLPSSKTCPSCPKRLVARWYPFSWHKLRETSLSQLNKK